MWCRKKHFRSLSDGYWYLDTLLLLLPLAVVAVAVVSGDRQSVDYLEVRFTIITSVTLRLS